MALLFWDGLDHYNNTNDLLSRAGVLQYAGGTGGSFTSQGQGRNFNAKGYSGTIIASLANRYPDALRNVPNTKTG